VWDDAWDPHVLMSGQGEFGEWECIVRWREMLNCQGVRPGQIRKGATQVVVG
jgi:hypothetical protein